jgi:D-alanyl-D-alanine carboxypeptidase
MWIEGRRGDNDRSSPRASGRIRLGLAFLALGAFLLWPAAAVNAHGERSGSTRQFSRSTVRALGSIVATALGAARIPGGIVGVWVPGEGNFVRTFGIGDIKTGVPVRIDDHFRIASISKSFTATAVLQLVDQKRLRLSDRLSTFVSGIPNGSRITIAQLLDMTSGIHDYTNDPGFVRAYTKTPNLRFAPRDLIAIIRRHKPLFAPGSDVFYDNSNYYLLGLVVQKVTGRTLGQVIQSQILKPLGLKETSYPTSAAMPSPYSRGYVVENGALRDVTGSSPDISEGAGAMISTLGDLKIWAKALATGTLLSPATQALRLRARVVAQSPKITARYGMGITNVNGFIGHDGAILGYGSVVFYLPSRDATIVVLGNNNDLVSTIPALIGLGIGAYLFPGQFPRGF